MADPEEVTTGPEAVTTGPEAVTAGSQAEMADPEAVTTGPEAVAAGPEAVTAGTKAEMTDPEEVTTSPEAVTTGPEAVTTGPEAVTAGSQAEMADPEAVTTGPEAVTTGPEAVTAGTEAEMTDPEEVTAYRKKDGGAQFSDYSKRLIPILTELVQDLKKYWDSNNDEWWQYNDDKKAPEMERILDQLQTALRRGDHMDSVSEDEQIAITCPRVQHALKIIKGLGPETKETNFLVRMVLWTAAICYGALAPYKYSSIRELGKYELDEPLIHILLRYVHLRNEHMELFQKFLIVHGTVKVDCFNSGGVTPLYLAIKNNNLEIVRDMIRLRGANYLKVSRGNDSALHAAVGHPAILKFLLKSNLIPGSKYYNNKGYTAIHLAVICKQLHQFKLIVDANSCYLSEIVKRENKTCLHLAVENENVEIVEAIFKELERRFGYREYSKHIILSQVDENGHTAFQTALEGKNKDIIGVFLRNGAPLSKKGKNEKTVLEILVTHFNDASNILSDAFDDSISTSTTTGETTIDYSSFTDSKDTSQISLIGKIVQCDQSDLLLHPVIKSYVYLKWNYFLPLFYVIISVHAIFLITFNVLVANIFYYRDTTNISLRTNQTSNSAVPWFQLYGWRYWTLITLMYSIITVLIVQELFTIYTKRNQWRHQLADRETWMRLVFLVLAIFLPVVLACAEPADWQRHLACAALLLGWLQAMFLLSRFPSWGSYVLMFGRVAFNLLKILASMLFLIIGFSFCFMIQYRSTPPFNGPVAAFFKTLVMMSSEFDYEDLFGEDHDEELRDTILVVRLLFLLFVVFVAIALMNFMTGAAVSDINELTVRAEKRTLEKQVQLLDTIEAILYDGALAKIFKRMFKRGRYYKQITYSTTMVTKWKLISVNVLEKDTDQDNECEGLFEYVSNNTGTGYKINIVEQTCEVRPSVKLNEAFVKIRRKKEWREEKNNVYITNNKIEELHEAFLVKPEGEEKGNKDWVCEAISKQEEIIESLAYDMNSKIEKLISNQNQTYDRIKELIGEIKKMAKENQ